MNGLKPKTVAQSYLAARREGLPIKELILAVDHDQGGKEFIKRMKQIVNADLIREKLPSKGKDWNNELKKGAKEKPFSKHFSPSRNRPNEQELSMNG
jgi:hypothetical protein